MCAMRYTARWQSPRGPTTVPALHLDRAGEDPTQTPARMQPAVADDAFVVDDAVDGALDVDQDIQLKLEGRDGGNEERCATWPSASGGGACGSP